ncbi:MAG: hypothetical protein EA370_17895, partial [Wenzhouxiangella sp.]
IFLYLKRIALLVDKLETQAPEQWQALGCPRQKWHEQPWGRLSTVEPLGPLLKWILAGEFGSLAPALAATARGVRQLFFASLASFAVFIATFIWFVNRAA